jgi:hypothetical protein
MSRLPYDVSRQQQRQEECRVWCRDRDRNGHATGLFLPCPLPAGHSPEHARIESVVHSGRSKIEFRCYSSKPESDCDSTLSEKLKQSIRDAKRAKKDAKRGKKG